MIAELIIFIGLIIYLIIMIETQYKNITNITMVALGVSLFINMSFSYRFNIKTVNIIENQMVALTKCMNVLKDISID